jgi:hypothetical protein
MKFRNKEINVTAVFLAWVYLAMIKENQPKGSSGGFW